MIAMSDQVWIAEAHRDNGKRFIARADENKNWTLLVSSATAGRLDPATVVVQAPLHFMKEDKPVEVLKITLEKTGNSASLLVAWGTYRLHGSFKAA